MREDLEHEANHEAEREVRSELMKQLATRVTFEVPQALLEREIDRRVEEFVRRLIDQQIDPMKTNINWEDFRERQQEAAAEAVRGALVLDEVARREAVAVAHDEVEAEIANMPSGRAGHRRLFARGWRRRGGRDVCIRGCGGSGRLISCCRRATIVRKRKTTCPSSPNS